MSVVFSAIIPSYNQAAFVGHAIQSALDQRLPGGAETEVIVVDDESSDSTPQVASSFVKRITYLRQTNRREGAARNAGAARARGTYFAFLDSDDYWLPGKLAGDLARFEQADHPALVYSRGRNVDSSDRVIGERHLDHPQGDVFWRLAREAFMPMSTVAVRADAFRACGGFVDQTATCIRVHARNMSADPGYMQRAMLSGVRYALQDPVIAARARGRERFIRACMYVTIGLNAYANGHRHRAWLWLARAVAAWPAQLADPRFVGAASRALLGPGFLTTVRRIAGA